MNNKEIKENKEKTKNKSSDTNHNFSKIFIIVLILHIILLYVLPGLKEIVIEKPTLTRITFGENNATVDVAPKKQKTPTKPKEEPKQKIVKKETQPKVEEKVVPKPVEKPKEIVKETVEPKKETPKPIEKKVVPKVVELPPLEATQSIDDLDLLATTNTDVTRTIPVVSDKVKKINVEDDPIISPTQPKDVKLNDVTDKKIDNSPKLDEVSDPTTKPTTPKTDKIAINSPTGEDIDNIEFDDLMAEDNPTVVGPKSGLKVGSKDGKSRVEWSPSNKDPKYPLEAEKNAQTADVKIILEVDSSGKVIKVMPVKTGVEVIDKAVEDVAYTWNIKLISNGLTVAGKVEVEYKFRLKGRE